jgi:hypothetical protein
MRHLFSVISVLVALGGLALFYFAIYVPETSSPFHSSRQRVAIAGIGLLLTAIGLVTRQILVQTEPPLVFQDAEQIPAVPI